MGKTFTMYRSMRNEYMILFRQPEGKRRLGEPGVDKRIILQLIVDKL
jgi:hypothetical protein